jgi:HlyD family secretion protein
MIRDTSQQDQVIAAPANRFPRRKALLLVVGLTLAGAGYGLLQGWSSSEQSISAARLRIGEVTRGTLIRDAAVNGRIVAAVSPTLYSTSTSTVELKVHAGDTVKKGQVLTDELKKEQTLFNELQAEVARQQILARKQKLAAQREADTAEIDRVSAMRTLQRYESVSTEGIIAKIDMQKAKDAVAAADIRARHTKQAAELEGDNVALELKTKTAQMERQKLSLANAQRRVDELTVRAPVDGFIGTLSVANRSVVQANTPLMTLVDLSQLEVELEVPESYVNDLGLGMSAEIEVAGAKTRGKLSALSPEVVKNQVLARVRFDKQPEGLRQSQRVAARLLIDEKPNVLMVQRGPFVESEGGRYVYLVQDGIAVRTPVQLGATSVAAVEIVNGLKQGDKIVIAGTENFENAKRVSINK